MIQIGLGWGLVETIFFSLNMMVPLQGGVWWLHHKLFFNYRYFTISFFLSQKKKKKFGEGFYQYPKDEPNIQRGGGRMII
jgi:hypothetical protein